MSKIYGLRFGEWLEVLDKACKLKEYESSKLIKDYKKYLHDTKKLMSLYVKYNKKYEKEFQKLWKKKKKGKLECIVDVDVIKILLEHLKAKKEV